jgi:hypothetical protein
VRLADGARRVVCWFSPRTAAAEDMAYSVTVTGACKSQMFAGWDDCQGTATYPAFKNGK